MNDFKNVWERILENSNKIELTTKTNSKAKSLSVFMKKYTVPEGYRITENNFQTKKDIRYIPIYATFCLDNLTI